MQETADARIWNITRVTQQVKQHLLIQTYSRHFGSGPCIRTYAGPDVVSQPKMSTNSLPPQILSNRHWRLIKVQPFITILISLQKWLWQVSCRNAQLLILVQRICFMQALSFIGLSRSLSSPMMFSYLFHPSFLHSNIDLFSSNTLLSLEGYC